MRGGEESTRAQAVFLLLVQLSLVLAGAMLEQQDSADCDYGATTTIIPSKKSHDNDCNIATDSIVNNGKSSPEATTNGGGVVTTLSSPSSTSSTTTTTTTVRIHTTYKKRANKFMNRPNVQNGLGANSIIHPYGTTVSSGLGVASASLGGGSKILNHSNNSYKNGHNQHSSQLHSLYSSGSNRNNNHNHRSLTTRSSLFHDGGGSGGGSITSPQGTATTASTTITTVESRPPFVTTVTRGRFLPSKFDLMVEKSLFTFSSRPKPVGLITRHQCSLSGGPLTENIASQNCQPRGAHDYFNVMWDPHIYRGTTTTLTSSLKQPERDLNNKDQERYRKRRAFLAGTGQNNIPNGNAEKNSNINTNHFNPVGVVGPANNRNRYRMTTKVTSRSKTFPPPEGRHQVHVQTEDYLEDLTRDVASKGPEVDAIVQTDPIEDNDLISSSALNQGRSRSGKSGARILPKSGIDASTQVLPGELITFDERVQPIVEAVVGKILEQALLETMEEEEIGALKAQQNRFLEKRKEEERELKRLQEQQERISAEKERLKRHLEMQLMRQQQLQNQNGDSDDAQLSSPTTTPLDNGNSSNGNDGTGNNNAMSTSYLLELLPSVINSLRQEGLITDQIGDEVLTSFVPLWVRSNREESNTDNSTVDRMAGDDDVDAFDPLPDGYQSRVNSLDNVNAEQKDSAVASTAGGSDTENATVQPEPEPTPVDKDGPEETNASGAIEEEKQEDNSDGQNQIEEENDTIVIEADGGSDNTEKPETSDNNAENLTNNTEESLDGDDASGENVEASPTENPESSSSLQLPNGVIPNLESKED